VNFKEKLILIKGLMIDQGVGGVVNLVRTYFSNKFEPIHVKSLPISLQIEPTVKCNLRCVMCARSYKNIKKPDMTLDQLKHILSQFNYARDIKLQGLGEPLLNKEFFSMLEFLKGRGLRVEITTNGTVLDEATSRKIIALGVDHIAISIDSASKKQYEEIRKGAKFEKVVENLRRFNKLNKNERTKVAVWTVATEDNIPGIPDIIKLLSEIGVKNYLVQTPHSWGLSNVKKALKDIDTKRHKNMLLEYKNIANNSGIDLQLMNVPFLKKKSKRVCKWPWMSVYITVDGYVTPCCMQGSDPEIINFGNVFKQNFSEIWNNKKYKDFRAKLKSKKPPEVCRGCPGY